MTTLIVATPVLLSVRPQRSRRDPMRNFSFWLAMRQRAEAAQRMRDTKEAELKLARLRAEMERDNVKR
jgi:hypothetical protein